MIQGIILISLIVFAIWYCFLEGEIFGKIGVWLEAKLPNSIWKPLIGCPVCMVFWHGLYIAYFLHLPLWYVIPALGLNAVIVKWWPDND